MARAIAKFGETFGISSLHRVGHRALCQGLIPPDPDGVLVEAFLISTVVVGLAEIGDKTQILSVMLAARFQRPVPIIFGILFATLANHAAAGFAGALFGSLLAGPWMRWILGLSFLSVGVWALFPDMYEGDAKAISHWGRLSRPLSLFSSPRLATRPGLRPWALPHDSRNSIRLLWARRWG